MELKETKIPSNTLEQLLKGHFAIQNLNYYNTNSEISIFKGGKVYQKLTK